MKHGLFSDSQPYLVRFAYDGLKRQRLTEPYVTDGEGGLVAERWQTALPAVSTSLGNVKYNTLLTPVP